MRRDFGLEIPPLDEDDTAETYLEKFGELLKVKKRWSIRRHLTLALLSFGKLLMYRDLDPKTWPPGDSIAQHPQCVSCLKALKSRRLRWPKSLPSTSLN